MAEKLKQPAVRHYQHWLSNDLRHGFDSYTYGEETTKLLDELFALVKTIVPYRKNGARELWFRVERGTPEDYGDVNEAIEDGEVKNAQEFYDYWKWEFPNEFEWYNFAAFEAEDSKYRVIFLGHKVVISECDRDDPTPLRYDISEFVQWLIDSVRECIAMLKDGTYNDFVRENLPPEHRTGTILRKHYWDVWPECREEFFKDISKEDVEEICELAYAQKDETDLIPLKEMAANDFYRFCAMGYAENNYDGCDKTPKEQYYLHADGRDEGLADIDPDSPEAFYKWYTGNRGGGHPWEVCRGGNSTHVSLYVHRKENGYTLRVAGDAWNRTIETVKFFLALKRAGLPVLLDEAEMLADRLLEKEKIGIVPSGVFPDYCESWFPNEHIIDFMNLPYEDTEKFLPFCVCQDIEPVYLINQREKSNEL